jgi:hypothetical protein
VDLSEGQRAFIEATPSAAMITIGPQGVPKVARCGVAIVDGNVWSSGTQARVRTRRLRTDPRCTLYVHEAGPRWLALETAVTILDGPDVPEQSVRLFRTMQRRTDGPLLWHGAERDEAEFQRLMHDEGRVIYQFAIDHAYGPV